MTKNEFIEEIKRRFPESAIETLKDALDRVKGTEYEHIFSGEIEVILKEIEERLEYLRTEIENERISYGELADLQGLAEHIDPSDVLLLEWAGVPEN